MLTRTPRGGVMDMDQTPPIWPESAGSIRKRHVILRSFITPTAASGSASGRFVRGARVHDFASCQGRTRPYGDEGPPSVNDAREQAPYQICYATTPETPCG